MLKLLLRFSPLAIILAALLAAPQQPSFARFPGGSTQQATQAANPNVWTFCYSGTGIVAPCTATGTVSTVATAGAVVTWVSKWNSGITPAGPLNDFSSFGHVQLVFQGPNSGTLNFTALVIGDAQTTGGGKCSSNTVFCNWDFAATPTTVTIGGTTCISPAPAACKIGNVQKSTDSVAFTHDPNKPLIVAFNTDATSTYTVETPGSTNTSPVGTQTTWFNVYSLTGTAQAATVQKNSGYTNASDRIRGIVKIIGTP